MRIELEWGAAAISYLPPPDLYLIIDVLSFSTAIDIALSRQAMVWPYHYKDERASAYAEQQQARLVGPRSHSQPSLSPASLQKLPVGSRLVLPSPNGASLSLLTGQVSCLSVCLRNAEASARWIQAQGFAQILVVPAGERWPDQRLRPALEDLLGAGAVIQALQHSAGGAKPELSIEASWAASSFEQVKDSLHSTLQACQSGQELQARGYPQDIQLAAELNSSQSVAKLNAAGAYTCV